MDKFAQYDNYESILIAGRTLLGYYSYLSGKNFALVETDQWSEADLEEYRKIDGLIVPDDKLVKVKYDLPKESVFLNKVDKTYNTFESFIRSHCNLSNSYSTQASVLLNEFSHSIGRPISANKEFPALMIKLMSTPDYSHIEKKSTAKGVIYIGIALKSRPFNEKLGKKRTPNNFVATRSSQPMVLIPITAENVTHLPTVNTPQR